MSVSADESGSSSSCSGVSATQLIFSSSDVIVDEPSSDSEDSAPFPVSVQRLLEAKAAITVEHALIPYKVSPFADTFSAPGWCPAPSDRTRSYSTASPRLCPATPRCIQNLRGHTEFQFLPLSLVLLRPFVVLARPPLCLFHGEFGRLQAPHLSALSFEAYHAAHAGKIDVTQAN
ncbi:unnamed protein product [[Candida] boidinii]|uniref:Unnamed protein product n=1 Tax=Candida boidinii TaxID=5477 RepID=A0A9W6WG74_CANBO|nr:unnamed protein product [[Candida] boidinii]GMF08845.1 unnamed protein product [[Candida] boidinii]GMG11385.1 unnamed protein product [[Candida] boidinii]